VSRRKLPRVRRYGTLDEICGYGSGEADEQPTPEAVQATLTKLETAGTPAEVQPSPAEVRTSAITPPAEVFTSAPAKLVLPQKRVAEVRKHERRPATHRRVNFWLDKAEKKRVQDFAKSLDMTLTDFLTFAAVHAMECAEVQRAKNAEVNTSSEDMKIFKAPDDIVMSYRELTGNKWRPADDVTSRPYWDTDRRLIECGIINTLLKTKQSKINSFAYFVPEIQEALAIPYGEEAIEAMHRRRRSQWDGLKKKGKCEVK
jgi:hypothetical protein